MEFLGSLAIKGGRRRLNRSVNLFKHDDEALGRRLHLVLFEQLFAARDSEWKIFNVISRLNVGLGSSRIPVLNPAPPKKNNRKLLTINIMK